jgi:hypothetical protein
MLIIKPFGRLGNNISQIMKTLSYALSFKIPEKINFILLKKYQPEILKNFPDYLFSGNNLNNNITNSFWDCKIDYSNYEKIVEIISKFINYKINSNINFEETLIIHIRGGDSFQMGNPNYWKHVPFYVYKDIIDNSNYKYIKILGEDYRNPTIKKILETYTNSFIEFKDAAEDFKIIMNAIHFVDSNSSFSSSALVFNKNIKTLYSSYDLHNYKKLNLYKNTVNVKIYNLKEYMSMKFNTFMDQINFLLLDKDPYN